MTPGPDRYTDDACISLKMTDRVSPKGPLAFRLSWPESGGDPLQKRKTIAAMHIASLLDAWTGRILKHRRDSPWIETTR